MATTNAPQVGATDDAPAADDSATVAQPDQRPTCDRTRRVRESWRS